MHIGVARNTRMAESAAASFAQKWFNGTSLLTATTVMVLRFLCVWDAPAPDDSLSGWWTFAARPPFTWG
jgi:hypothetical protein